MTDLRIERGSVTFTTDDAMSLEQVSELARAAQIMGIAPTAKITDVRYHWSGTECQFEIYWTLHR